MTRAVVAAALAFLLLPSPASSQDAPPQGTVDVIDLWNIVRHKPPAAADAGADDYRRPMKAWAPVIGAKPSAGLMAGIAGNVAFFRGEPATTHISSLVTSLTFSTKKQTSLTGRFMLF